MKTIEQFKQIIINLREEEAYSPNVHRKQAQITKLNKAVELNQRCINALEQGVTEESVRQQMDVLEAYMVRCDEQYETWKKNTPGLKDVKSIPNFYRKEMELPRKEKQLKFLIYLLS